MLSLFLCLCVLLSSTSFIQAEGTEPLNYFQCEVFKPKRIDVTVETGSKFLAGTNDGIHLLLRDSQGVVCTADDLNNVGDDHERNSIDKYAVCCPQDFAKTNDSLSLLLVGHKHGYRGGANDWFVERIEVHKEDSLLFTYHFHAWTNPRKISIFGVSKVTSSHSDNGKPSYSRIRL
ncbi:unnamed protein product [Adineta steineri]|uniref:PLAT domain-containing protein n=1 Tax=Adineta steineri TaxID=433720 RepID=A0A815GUD7_9BILA|nr:unnamed protein product [Adineta steineri]CAF1594849.1 unnamed protein product [Adineta steineri]